MADTTDRPERVIARIDKANTLDPNRETYQGQSMPAALLYGQRMSRWLDRVDDAASEPLRIAARAQHIERWIIPRDAYPQNRTGYLQWRTDLGKFHADRAGQIMGDEGYDEPAIAAVSTMLRKQQLKTNPDTQTLEDVACLVFLESYFADFSTQHDRDKIVRILRKTWAKMSQRGRELALTIEMAHDARELVNQALAG